MNQPPRDFHPNEELISAWLDQALEAHEREIMDAHLADCPRCRALAEDLGTLSRSIAGEPSPPVPANLAARIRLQVEQAGAPGSAGETASERLPITLPSGRPERPGRPAESFVERLVRLASRSRPWRGPFALAAAGLAVATLVWVAVRREAPLPAPDVDRISQMLPAAPPPPPPPPPAGNSLESAPEGDRTARKEKVARADSRENLKEMGHLQPAAPGEAPAARGKFADSEATGSEHQLVAGGTAGRVAPAPAGAAAYGAADEGKTNRADGKDLSKTSGEPAPVAGAIAPSPAAAPSLDRMKKHDAPTAAALEESPALKSRTSSSRNAVAGGVARPEPSPMGGAGEPPAGARKLFYETPQVTIELSEDGLVTLVQRGYACSVSVATPAAEPGRAPFVPPELATLFEQAASRDLRKALTGAVAASPEEGGTNRPDSITLRGPDGAALYAVSFGDTPETAPPAAVSDLEAAIRRVVGIHFRPNLESRCGPIPESPGALTP